MTDNQESQTPLTWPDALLFAYTPSGEREGFKFMLIYGLLGVLLSSGLLAGFELALFTYVPELDVSSFPNLIMALGAGLIPGLVAGALVGTVVGRGALRDKNRDPHFARRVGALFGCFIVVVYVVVRLVVYRAAAFDSALDFSRVIMFAMPAILLAFDRADRAIVTMPFCEECGTWMEQFVIKHIPASDPEVVLPLLEDRDFTVLASQAGEADDPYIASMDLQIWYCPNCQSSGYLNVIRTAGRVKRGSMESIVDFPPEPRQIISEELTAEEVARALSTRLPSASS